MVASPRPGARRYFARSSSVRRASSSSTRSIADPNSQAARALGSLGVSAEQIGGALAATSTEGTTDEMPEAAIARIASIQTVEGGVEITIADVDLAKLLKGGTPELTGALAHALDQLRTSREREARKTQAAGGASMEA
jgi:hypothetical protein